MTTVSKQLAKKLYSKLLSIRMVEERIANEYKTGEIRCPTHLYIGQEGIGVGVIEHLRKKDIVFSYHRSHGHYLAKGGNLRAMIAELYGKVTGCSKGMGGSQHLIDLSVNFCGAIPIVSETIPLAVGAVWAEKMKGNDTTGVVFFGDAATEEGIFAESVNFAVLKEIPLLFVCENNYYSISTPILARQPSVSIAPRVAGMGIQTYSGDGNDVLTVFELTKQALFYVQKEQKPAFIEFRTYRYLEHCGPQYDPLGYRPQSELDTWLKKDPLIKMEKYIRKNTLLTNGEILNMKKKTARDIEDAFQFAKESPYPQEKDFREKIFA